MPGVHHSCGGRDGGHRHLRVEDGPVREGHHLEHDGKPLYVGRPQSKFIIKSAMSKVKARELTALTPSREQREQDEVSERILR